MQKYIGTLPVVNTVSDISPQGAGGFLVRLTLETSQKLTEFLAGKPVLSKHRGDEIGTINEATMRDKEISIFCEAEEGLDGRNISYEIVGALISDRKAKIWEVTDFLETNGVAVVPKYGKPAYKNSVLRRVE